MIILALNYGFGPKDTQDLAWDHIDGERVTLPRSKTGVCQTYLLWPETLQLLNEGDAGEEYGLSLFRGPEAAACLAALQDRDGPGDDAPEDINILGFSMEAFGDLPPDAQVLMREVGQHPRHDEQVPHLLAKPPGRQPRLPDDCESVILLMVLRGVVEADRRKLLEPARLGDKKGICILALSGDPVSPQVSVTREQWQLHEVFKTAALPPERPDLRGLPRLNETWLVGMPALPARVKGDDRVL